MRAKLLGAALAALLAPVAFAADVPRIGHIAASPATAQEPAWNRSGFYAGLLGAYDTTVLEAEGIDLAGGKLMAGALVGWNWRLAPGFVAGLEADWIFTGIRVSETVDDVTLRASADHLVSLRVRAGIPAGPALLYATAGPAWQHAKLTLSGEEGSVSEREWQLGLAAGGGGEVELTRSFVVRLEALHYVFPDDGVSFVDSENQHTTVRVGAIFKLN